MFGENCPTKGTNFDSFVLDGNFYRGFISKIQSHGPSKYPDINDAVIQSFDIATTKLTMRPTQSMRFFSLLKNVYQSSPEY